MNIKECRIANGAERVLSLIEDFYTSNHTDYEEIIETNEEVIRRLEINNDALKKILQKKY